METGYPAHCVHTDQLPTRTNPIISPPIPINSPQIVLLANTFRNSLPLRIKLPTHLSGMWEELKQEKPLVTGRTCKLHADIRIKTVPGAERQQLYQLCSCAGYFKQKSNTFYK